MPLRYKRRLLQHLKHDDYTPRRIADVASDLSIEPAELAEFDAAVRQLAEEGAVHLDQQGFVMLPTLTKVAQRDGGLVIGSFRKNPRGFGFVEPLIAVREKS